MYKRQVKGFSSHVIWGFLDEGHIDQDQAKAKELLAEAGYPDGFETRIYASTTGYKYCLLYTSIISMYSRSPKAFKLFAQDDSIKTPQDLKGKKVAGPKGTILHELLVAYLATADMTEDDIQFMAMGIPDAQAALAGGSVDAALLAGPVAYNMEKDGFYVVTDGEGLTEASIATATSQKFYDEHPELVKAFLEAQKKVLDSIEADFDAAVAATAKETELSEDAVKEMYSLYDFSMEITDKDIKAMEKTEEFMRNTAMIENPVEMCIRDRHYTIEYRGVTLEKKNNYWKFRIEFVCYPWYG